jgi:hypothetical protein
MSWLRAIAARQLPPSETNNTPSPATTPSPANNTAQTALPVPSWIANHVRQAHCFDPVIPPPPAATPAVKVARVTLDNVVTLACTQNETIILAQAALDISARAGRTCMGSVVGILAQPNAMGQLSSARVAELTKVSATHVKASRKKVNSGDLGTFGSLAKAVPQAKAPDLQRIPVVEVVCICVRAPALPFFVFFLVD